ncbi:MAG TPA: hypothetical protein VLS90_00845 [Thermodesulfobacteriota bacterium]|nr:hypothetical protein [Thermodesulfobacteriota bacterium]
MEMLQNGKSEKNTIPGNSSTLGVFFRRIRSAWSEMKMSWNEEEQDFAGNASASYPEIPGQQMMTPGYLTGTILVECGVITSAQLVEALKRQKGYEEQGKRKSLGIILVEMGYTTSRKYIEALSTYFNLPIMSLIKFIPSPSVQSILADRYVRQHKLLVLADYGDEVSVALAEPDPLILDDLKKIFRTKKLNLFLANPLEIERCYRFYLDPFASNYYR